VGRGAWERALLRAAEENDWVCAARYLRRVESEEVVDSVLNDASKRATAKRLERLCTVGGARFRLDHLERVLRKWQTKPEIKVDALDAMLRGARLDDREALLLLASSALHAQPVLYERVLRWMLPTPKDAAAVAFVTCHRRPLRRRVRDATRRTLALGLAPGWTSPDYATEDGFALFALTGAYTDSFLRMLDDAEDAHGNRNRVVNVARDACTYACALETAVAWGECLGGVFTDSGDDAVRLEILRYLLPTTPGAASAWREAMTHTIPNMGAMDACIAVAGHA